MVRFLKISLWTAAGFMLLLLGGTGWLLKTSSGARWLLTELPPHTGSRIAIGQLEGTLLGRLQLQSCRLDQGEQQLSIDRLESRSRLASLFPLRLEFELLSFTNLQLQSPAANSAPQPLRLAWPQLPAAAAWLEIDIASLQLTQLNWQQGEAPPQQLENFAAALSWREATLSGENIQLQFGELQIGQGQLQLGIQEPQLQIAAQLHNRAPAAGWRSLQIAANLQAAADYLLQGAATLQLQTEQAGSYQLSTNLALAETSLDFDQLRLVQTGRAGSLTAQGSYAFSSEQQLTSRLAINQLDLQPETGVPLLLSGSVQLSGQPQQYSGGFNLTSSGSPQTQGALRGQFHGDLHALQLSKLKGQWLGGELAGQLSASWDEGWQLQTDLQAERLQPQQLDPAWPGLVNLRLNGNLQGSADRGAMGQLQLQLHDSQLYQQPLAGDLLLHLAEDKIAVEQLQLQGDGFSVQAQGQVDEQFQLQVQIEQLEQLQPDLRGSLTAHGWLRWQEQQLEGQLSGQAHHLGYQHWRAEQLQLDLHGNLLEHQLALQLNQPPGQVQLKLSGSWQKDRWRGNLTQLQGESPELGDWQLTAAVPLEISAEEIIIAPLQLSSSGQASLQGFARFQLQDQQGQGELQWQQLPLQPLRNWLPLDSITGSSSGSLSMQLADPGQSKLHAALSLQGELQQQKVKLRLAASRLTADWDEQGLNTALELQLAEGGRLEALLESSQGLQAGLPEQGRFALGGQKFPLQLLHPWLPPTLNLAGQLALETTGQWSADRSFTMSGQAHTEQGKLIWLEDAGTVSAELSSARFDWQWHQDLLQGELALELSEQGEVSGQLRLPLASRLPVAPLPGTLQGELTAKLQELGLLSLIFPGAVQESRGQLNLNLQLAGDWQQPELTGKVHLFGAGAFLPTAGIQLEKIELLGNFNEQRLVIEQLQMFSGSGSLNGTGHLQLNRWQPGDYQLQLRGEKFQLLDLPDLQLQVDPDLQLSGNPQQVRVRGSLRIPELLLTGKQKSSLPSNSPDLVILDAEKPQRRTFRLQHDIDLKLQLGEQVLLKTAGIDAKLGGKLRLQSTPQQELAAIGEIKVEKGRYASYGVNLEIDRGHLYFTGGPIDQPNLDILALRKAGEVEAGVQVSGTPRQPQVKLYSQPSMPESDILAYIVLGRPLSADRSETGLLLSAAGALLSQGESVMVQEKLKQGLGLDVLDIDAGDGDVASSVITTGKYLSPDLYVSLGHSLFTNTNEVRVRYSITPKWELESNIGVESGVDMYYRIEIE